MYRILIRSKNIILGNIETTIHQIYDLPTNRKEIQYQIKQKKNQIGKKDSRLKAAKIFLISQIFDFYPHPSL